MKPGSIGVMALCGLAALASSARADETTWCNAYITTLPITINTQGHYCFDRNLSTSMATGHAITINSDFVVLDLNNFKLGGGGAGPATSAVGVYANDHSNLTIRNGNIRGFAFGIQIEGANKASAQNIVVENNTVDGNLVGGIFVFGDAYSIRNNRVSNTGGGTSATVAVCGPGLASIVTGIATYRAATPCPTGGTGEILDNTVTNTVDMTGGTGGVISIYAAFGGVVMRNRILTQNDGAFAAVFASLCRDNTAFQIASSAYGNCVVLVGTNTDN